MIRLRILALFMIAGLFLSSCGQFTPLHNARTEGDGNISISPTLDATGAVESNQGIVGLPGLRLEMAYGLSDKFDLVASLNSGGSIKASAKYIVYGDNYSNYLFTIMPGYEYQSSIFFTTNNQSSVQRLHLPLIFTARNSENLDFYAGPDLILQIESNAGNLIFPGVFAGIEIGQRIKYNIGAGGFIPFSFDTGQNGYAFQFGISARIPLYRR